MIKIFVKDRTEWRDWLSANHDKKAEVWLIFYKGKTGQPSIEYEASVEEALCFGWVDSIIKKLDETKYARKFTPRKADSVWSESNKERVEKMIRAGLMTESGMRKVEAAKRSGGWDEPVQKPELTFAMPPEFREALAKNKAAKENFDKLAPTYQKPFIGWIEITKRPETRAKRIRESIRLLEKGEKLGLR